jgi:hypothetical protein
LPFSVARSRRYVWATSRISLGAGTSSGFKSFGTSSTAAGGGVACCAATGTSSAAAIAIHRLVRVQRRAFDISKDSSTVVWSIRLRLIQCST